MTADDNGPHWAEKHQHMLVFVKVVQGGKALWTVLGGVEDILLKIKHPDSHRADLPDRDDFCFGATLDVINILKAAQEKVFIFFNAFTDKWSEAKDKRTEHLSTVKNRKAKCQQYSSEWRMGAELRE